MKKQRDNKGRFVKGSSGKNNVILGFKGFDKNMQCRGFQFKEGETYKHNGKALACNSGFHFCENPLDVFNYYAPGESVFHAVEGTGQTDRHTEDSKVACTEIKNGLSVKLHDYIGAAVKFMFSRKYEEISSNHTTGYSSASSATGYRSASSATGDSSASSATGDSSASSATGYSSASSATGYRSASSATGDSSASSATGYRSASSATGDSSASSATGYASCAASTGYNSKVMAGKFGVIALAWWNVECKRFEMRCAETGCGDGSDGKLKSNTWYQLSDKGEFEEVNR